MIARNATQVCAEFRPVAMHFLATLLATSTTGNNRFEHVRTYSELTEEVWGEVNVN